MHNLNPFRLLNLLSPTNSLHFLYCIVKLSLSIASISGVFVFIICLLALYLLGSCYLVVLGFSPHLTLFINNTIEPSRKLRKCGNSSQFLLKTSRLKILIFFKLYYIFSHIRQSKTDLAMTGLANESYCQ